MALPLSFILETAPTLLISGVVWRVVRRNSDRCWWYGLGILFEQALGASRVSIKSKFLGGQGGPYVINSSIWFEQFKNLEKPAPKCMTGQASFNAFSVFIHNLVQLKENRLKGGLFRGMKPQKIQLHRGQ